MTATLGRSSDHRDVATEVLRRGRDVVTPALQAAVDRLDDASRTQARYHLGWTELDGSPGAGGGKAVRPALALLSATAAGADVDTGVPGAVAVELVHNFSLLHDDLMDGDAERRHRTTVWVQWGASSAILCGDAMLALAQEVLLEAPSAHAAAAAALLAVTTRELIRGQAEDLAFETRDDVGVAECLSMASGKTGSLLAASASIGAVLAGAPAAQTEALHTYGHEVGTAFQLVDDLLGIWGDPAVTGKPVLSDLRSRKKSLPVTFAIRNGGEAGRELARWLATEGEPAEDELHAAARLVAAGGGREWAAAEARRRRDLALGAVTGAGLAPVPTGELVALAHHLVDREF
ncbi:polyprenyl synthetase family protein [Pseudonocardia sp. N23]|uniref:polyprenyl synthetase family protein n=1 Tax=Pseudonocardia sp. N23 TaxID=1987376 RepID=UPI000BFEA0A9|nr:polyprenyl synthetase family protein [Pseudonocardia sp. N23]GAY11561.1 octaprenyl diphosphate synthase [Pseudonocardia sp. N23]